MATKTGLPTTKEEVLKILINRTTPQAIIKDERGDETCTYLHSKNGGCAIGQCVSSNRAILMEGDGNFTVSQLVNNGTLPKRLFKLGQDFLRDIQMIHDVDSMWNNHENATKIGGYVWSKKGISLINQIIVKYKLNLKEI